MYVTKRDVLELLTKQRLIELAGQFEIALAVNKPKADFVAALVRARRVFIADVLNALSRDELKMVCRGVGLDDSGRAKQEIVDRILSTGGADEEIEDEIDRTGDRPVAPREANQEFSLTLPERVFKPEVKRRLEPGPAFWTDTKCKLDKTLRMRKVAFFA